MGRGDGSGRIVSPDDADDTDTGILHVDMDAFYASVEILDDPSLTGTVIISAGDMGTLARAPLPVRVKTASENMEALAGVTAESMAADLATLTPAQTLISAAPGLSGKPLLVLTSDDGLAPSSDALAAEVTKRGGKVTAVHIATDHGYNSARIRLESEILTWLATLPK